MLQIIYVVLCILGFVLPYSQVIPFVIENGLDLKIFFQQLFVNQISTDFGMDVFVSSLVFWVFVFWEGWRLKMRYLWIYVASNLIVGLSLGLPLFLLMRHRQIDRQGEFAKVDN